MDCDDSRTGPKQPAHVRSTTSEGPLDPIRSVARRLRAAGRAAVLTAVSLLVSGGGAVFVSAPAASDAPRTASEGSTTRDSPKTASNGASAGGERPADWTPAQEARLGEVADHFLTQTDGLYTEKPGLTDYVEKVGKPLAERAGGVVPVSHFGVLDSADVSAYGLPGGYVYVSRGLLALLGSEDELAAAIAHEIAHVAARHDLRRIPEAEARPLISGGAALATDPRFIPQVDRTARDIATRAAAGYTPEQEQEAGRLAASYLKKAGYGDAGLRTLQETLAWAQARVPDRLAPWLAAHGGGAPQAGSKGDRARDTARVKSRKGLRRDPYLAAIDGILMGVANQNGLVSGNRYIGRSRDYAILVPQGWHPRLRGADLDLIDPVSGASATVTMQTLVRPGISGDVAREYVRSQSLTDGLESAGPITKATVPAGEAAIARLYGRNAAGATQLVRKAFLVRFDRVYVITFTSPKDSDEATQPTFMTLTGSFKYLGPDDARDVTEPRLTIHVAAPGETWASLASGVGPPPLTAADLAAFNGFEARAALPAKIKMPPAGSLE